MEDWKEKFIDYTDSLRTAEALAIRQQNMPKKIFRYRAVTEHSLEDFKNDTVWLCSPGKYNDPYDSTWTVNFEKIIATRLLQNAEYAKGISDDEMEKIQTSLEPLNTFIKIHLKKSKYPAAREVPEDIYEDVLEKIAVTFKKTFRRQLENLAKKILYVTRDNLKICSFSETKSSIVMWAHYAKNHEGFCIEYDLASLDEKKDPRDSLFPIIYSDKLCDVSHLFGFAMELRGNPGALEAIQEVVRSADVLKAKTIIKKFKISEFLRFMFKSQGWSYEKEWRLYFSDELPQPERSYPMPTPSAIYLGARMKERNKKRLCNIAASKNIDVYQMNLSGLEFKLYEEKIGVNIPESILETEEFKLLMEKLKAEFPSLAEI